MDKPSERTKQAKECGDVDIGIQRYGVDNVREQLPGLWSVASKEVVGLPPSRLMTNCYKKEVPGEKEGKPSLLDKIIESGPPVLNVSRPPRVF